MRPPAGDPPPAEALTDASAVRRLREEGVHRISVATPFRIGRVNLYLIEDDPLTLIDCGPNSAEALRDVEQGLRGLGHAIEDLELLVITHQHLDHCGLAGTIARRSGAEVASLDLLAPYLEDFAEEAEADDRFAELMMLRNGVPSDVANTLRAVAASFRSFGTSVRVSRPLRHEQELRLRDRTLHVLHRPGHSPSDTILWDEQRGMLFAGDHLLQRISSNPVFTRPIGADPEDLGVRPRALVTYIASMRRTREMNVDLVLPGHGEPFSDVRGLVEERLRLHDRRASRIHKLITNGIETADEIARAMWGNVAVTQAYLTISEVLGHTELLIEQGRVSERVEGGVVRLSAA